MEKKVLWLIVSCVMVLSLVLASCAPAAPPEEKPVAPPAEEKPTTPTTEEKPVTPPEEKAEPETVKVKLTKTDGTVVEKLVEKPRYGGVLNWVWYTSPSSFDEVWGLIWAARTQTVTNEGLMTGDWSKSSAGTDEATFGYYMFPPFDLVTGCLAESWELREPDTIIYHIRKGVHWAHDPDSEASRLVGGREMTADDVAFSLFRLWTEPRSWIHGNYPWRGNFVEKDGGPSITATDKWTVVLECKPGASSYMYEISSQVVEIIPPEVIEKYGDLRDWKNSVGTGAWMLKDYVPDSAIVFERNTNYWMKDPLIPENQLPYMDGVKILIIPDLSTQIAALRTGKIDHKGGYSNGPLEIDDASSLMQTNPELQWVETMEVPGVLYMRVDKPELPFQDIRVRQALNMAIDRQQLVDDYYSGHGEVYTLPVMPIPELKDQFVPFDQLPEHIREIYTYNPDKARKLLAEAGYPDGFQTNLLCTASSADLASIFKEYLAKIGVDVALEVKEPAVYSSIVASKTHNEMVLGSITSTIPLKFMYWLKGNYYNYSMVDDPVLEDAFRAARAAYFDRPKMSKIIADVVPYQLEQAHHVVGVSRMVYTFWQPWLKGYGGEFMIGYNSNWGVFHKYVWLDQDLKEEMTSTR